MFNLNDIAIRNDNKNWPHRTLIIGPPETGKTNALLNLIQQDNNSFIKFICMLKI